MKKIKFLGLVSAAIVGLALPASAGPRGGGVGFGGGGHIGGGGRVGGFAGGGSRAAPAFYGGGGRAAPVVRGSGAYFTGRSAGRLSRAPQLYRAPQFYGGGGRMSAVTPHSFSRSASRWITPDAGRVAAINRQSNRVGSVAPQNRVSNPRVSTAASRQSFIKNHAFARHDSSWHRDWDRHHAHFDHGHVFVFNDGFWWGLDPYDYYGDYPDDYSANPYDYYDYSPSDYDDQPAYSDSDQAVANATVSAVQSELAKLGYYNGSIDGTLGDQTEAAIARYQEDSDLSVTGTLDAATIQSLGIR